METYHQCPRCVGMGYKGRWRKATGADVRRPTQAIHQGLVWKIETCPRCGGRGTIDPPAKKE